MHSKIPRVRCGCDWKFCFYCVISFKNKGLKLRMFSLELQILKKHELAVSRKLTHADTLLFLNINKNLQEFYFTDWRFFAVCGKTFLRFEMT